MHSLRFISCPPSWRRGRRHASLGGLLERVGESEQTRLTTRTTAEAHAIRTRLRVESVRERRRRFIRKQGKRHDHTWIPGTRRKSRAARSGKENRVELMLLQNRVDAVGGRGQQVSRLVRLVTRTILLEVDFVRDIQSRLTIPDGAFLLMCDIPLAQPGERLHWRCRAECRQP